MEVYDALRDAQMHIEVARIIGAALLLLAGLVITNGIGGK